MHKDLHKQDRSPLKLGMKWVAWAALLAVAVIGLVVALSMFLGHDYRNAVGW